jgi:hypothetical protein
VGRYRHFCDQVSSDGYEGFTLSTAAKSTAATSTAAKEGVRVAG